MCGFYFSTVNRTAQEFKRKLNEIEHRGPDYTGIHIEDTISFGHKRLSIIDLDSRSHQPFLDENYILLFNGEIYNYKELKANLKKEGYTFKTNSDTEVLIKGYDFYKENLPSLLNGMFSFIIYNKKSKTLFGARDRTGQKPLFFKKGNKDIEFCSELSPLIEQESEINSDSLGYYILYGVMPNDDSIIKGIHKVMPAHYFIYSFQDESLVFKKYWENKTGTAKNKDYDYKEQFSHIFADATEKRLLESDVETAVFLSGGIDSTIVTKFGVQNGNVVSTLSVSFDNDKYDEGKYSKEVADVYKTKHRVVNCNTEEIKDFLLNVGELLDEPMADSSFLAELLISKVAKDNGVKVVLTGDGADEYFFGYKRYLWFLKVLRLKSFGLHKLVPKKIVPKKYRRYLDAFSLPTGMVYGFLMSGLDAKTYKRISKKVKNYSSYQVKRGMDCANVDKENYLVNDINIKVDRATMAFSIESRSPFLDYRVIEFANSLPDELKYNSKTQKVLLKEILREDFQDEFIYRSKKGFGVPLANWMEESFYEDIEKIINRNLFLIETFIEKTYVDNLLLDLKKGNFHTHHILWRIFVLCSWYEDKFKNN